MHLLLHIGPPKTGSTSIQESLGVNSDALKAAGILPVLYPSKANIDPLRALGARHYPEWRLRNWPFKQRFASPQEARDWSDTHWADLADTVRQSDADLCVISSEHLGYGVDVPGLVADLRGIFSGITILAYTRDPAALYFSSMQQSLRGGQPLSRLRTPESFYFRHREIIGKYVGTLGVENVMVRNFSRDNLHGRDVVLDFFAQLERFGKTVQVEPVQANESVPGAALALLMLLNEINFSDERTRPRQRLIKRLQTSKSVAQLPSFPPEMPEVKALIRARAAKDCAWINQTFLDGQKLLPLQTGPVPTYPGDAAWRAELRDALLAYLTPAAIAVIAAEVVGTHKTGRFPQKNGNKLESIY